MTLKRINYTIHFGRHYLLLFNLHNTKKLVSCLQVTSNSSNDFFHFQLLHCNMMMALSYCFTILNDNKAKADSLKKARDIYSKLVCGTEYHKLSTRKQR